MKRSGFRLPRLGASKLVTEWLGALLALSIIATLDGGFLTSRFALIPSRVWLGEIWRLVTWPLIEPGVMTLIITCAGLFKLGNELAVRWGDARLQQFMFHVLAGAASITVIVMPLCGYARAAHLGGWAVLDALTIGWARQFPTRPLGVYGLELSGQRLVRITIGVNVLFAIFVGPVHCVPELGACALAAYYPQRWLGR